MFRIENRHHRQSNCWRFRSGVPREILAQLVRYQRGLSYLSRTVLSVALLLGIIAQSVKAQQSTSYDQYELHHSIVYTTFLSPEVAAEYGITRGADKAMLTLSVRMPASGDTSGRPMQIVGRTWDLITGGDMDVKEIREGRATYYIVPFEFLDREYRFFEFTFQPEGVASRYEHKMKVQLWRQDYE